MVTLPKKKKRKGHSDGKETFKNVLNMMSHQGIQNKTNIFHNYILTRIAKCKHTDHCKY